MWKTLCVALLVPSIAFATEPETTLTLLDRVGKAFGWVALVLLTATSGWVSYQGARRAFFAARANILVACHNSYDQIQDGFHDVHIQLSSENPPNPATIRVSAKKLYSRFWGLQYAQYRYFMDGVLRRRDFRYWLSCRYRDYNAGPTNRYDFSGVTFRERWADWKENAADDEVFVRIMEICMDVGYQGPPSRERRKQAVDLAMGFARWYKSGALQRVYIEKTGKLSPALIAEIDRFDAIQRGASP